MSHVSAESLMFHCLKQFFSSENYSYTISLLGTKYFITAKYDEKILSQLFGLVKSFS